MSNDLSSLSNINVADAAKRAKDFKPGGSPIPDGEYDFRVESCEFKMTAAGDGSYLKLQLRVTGGEFDNRVVFDMATIANPNADAVKIGNDKIAGLAHASGMSVVPGNPSEFVGKVVGASVYTGKERTHNGKTYKPENQVSYYQPASSGAPAPSSVGDSDIPF
jgi:hypothetical protein